MAEVLGKPVASVHPVKGGRNSRVYEITCLATERYIVKVYPTAGPGQKDRLDTEFGCLSFLWDNGLRCIPRPIVADHKAGRAVYEHIEGTSVVSKELTRSDIGQAVDFLLRLKELRSAERTAVIEPAAEACFSVQAIFDSIDLRLKRLLSLEEETSPYLGLRRFLETGLQPALADARHRSEEKLGASIKSELSPQERTLSPSDFGFHNALRRPGGDLVFLDFEYFGWDDPAKMISDFLLHPAMELKGSLSSAFLSRVLNGFQEFPALERRVQLAYPLFGLKWCLILLNEFVPERLARRNLDEKDQTDSSLLQLRQLEKARALLQKVAANSMD